MEKISADFLVQFSKNLIYLKARNIQDIEQDILDKKLFKEGVSYIPILTNTRGQYLGTLSRKKYFFLKLKGKPFSPFKIIDPDIHVVSLDEGLDGILKKLKISSGLVLKIDGEYKKFISSRTVSDSFENYTTKLLLIETAENKLRDIILKLNINFTDSLSIKNQQFKNIKNELKEIKDLTFSDYNLIFNDKWGEFDLLNKFVSKSDFLKNLNNVSKFRNDVFHFRNELEFDEKPFRLIIKYLTYWGK